LRERAAALQSRSARLGSLAPEQTLQRGYSICVDTASGTIIREASHSHRGQPVKVLLAAGRLEATVDEAVE
jgi:exodeoxyribonuclease VII large subunit